jgi:hypothetical protein
MIFHQVITCNQQLSAARHYERSADLNYSYIMISLVKKFFCLFVLLPEAEI